ncbi:unnamed protein product [Caenorhabditis sp. 36 PRJEB53466]|nr:unnamed protein product [Caenorhabditis sp. 36 PRJEB53466]
MKTTKGPNNQFHFETWRLFDPIYLLFCVPVTIHYIFVLRVIRKLRDSNGYYFIFFLVGLSDVIYCCAMLTCELLNFTNSLPQVFFVFFVVVTYFGVFFNLLSNTLLAINRFCATCVWYNTYFDHHYIKLYFILIFFVSFVATLPGGVLMFIYLYLDFSLNAQYEKSGWGSFNLHRTIIIAIMLSDALTGILSTSCTVYRLRKYKINYDKSLLLVTFFHIFPDLLVAFFNLDLIFQFTGASQFTNELSRMFLFFLVSFNSLTIVCTNRVIRTEYLKVFVFWKQATVPPVKGISITASNLTPVDRVTVF